jgi:hypothetical protein
LSRRRAEVKFSLEAADARLLAAVLNNRNLPNSRNHLQKFQ